MPARGTVPRYWTDHYCNILLLSHLDRKRSPFPGEALAMNRNAFPLLDSFLCHQAKSNDERVYLAWNFSIGSHVLVIHEKPHLISDPGIADAIAVCLPGPGLYVQFIEIRKIFR